MERRPFCVGYGSVVLWWAAVLFAQGCAGNGERGETAAAGEALVLSVSNRAIAYDYAHRDALPHGIGGDERVIFVTEPLMGRVAVLDRVTGEEIAELPAPPGGFVLPFTLRVPEAGRLVISDPGGFPSPTSLVIPRIHEYRYTINRRGFSATHVRATRFDGIPFIFSEDLEVLRDGSIIVSDSGFGALWRIDPAGVIAPAITPASPSPFDGIPALSPCPFPSSGVPVGGIPFTLAGDFAPGVGSMTSDDTYLYFSSTCQGGLWRVPIAALTDDRAPHLRAQSIENISPRPAGTLAESLKGLAFDPYSRRGKIYAADPFRLRLIRIDPRTGAREVIGTDARLYNFSVASQVLPPVAGLSPVILSSDQEHRFSGINASLQMGDIFQLPFFLTKVYPRP